MTIIDAHVHLGQGEHLQLSADELLRLMDDANVEFAVASAVDRHLAVHNREGNDLLLEAVRKHRDRLGGMASANPWYGASAVEEVDRALGEGLLALKLHPLYQGFRLSDRLIDSLLEMAAKHRVPVYAPTGIAGIAEPFHLAELARRFPTVEFIMGHAGASDYYADAVRAVEMTDNLWLESSRNGPANYQLFQLRGCLDRLCFGSSAPEYAPATEAEIVRDTFDDEATLRSIFSGAARRLFGERLP